MKHVYSTLTASQKYTFWVEGGDLPMIERQIFIKGGANINLPRDGTPPGALTALSDEDFALLETHDQFKLHVKNGFIKVVDKKISVEKGTKDLKEKDLSAPKTPKDYPKGKQPVVGAPSQKDEDA